MPTIISRRSPAWAGLLGLRNRSTPHRPDRANQRNVRELSMAIPTLPPPSAKAVEIGERVKAFMDENIYPAEAVYERQLNESKDRWQSPPIMAELKAKAQQAGLWNMFLPKKHFPDSLTNLEYASICETMGRSPIGGEPFNFSAPDTGNMETLILYATPEPKKQWLEAPMAGGDPPTVSVNRTA